jgi:hypothetical protein
MIKIYSGLEILNFLVKQVQVFVILKYFSRGLLNLCTVYCAGILELSMGVKNKVGIGLSYRLAKLHRLAESIP